MSCTNNNIDMKGDDAEMVDEILTSLRQEDGCIITIASLACFKCNKINRCLSIYANATKSTNCLI